MKSHLDTLLANRDWALDICGKPIAVTGWKEELQCCLIRLQVPKGSFLYQPSFGSGLCALAENPEETDCAARALELAQEALLPLQNVRVRSADCQRDESGRLTGFLIRLAGKDWEKEVLIQTDG